MKAEFYKHQIDKLLTMVVAERGDQAEEVATLPVSSLLSEQRLAAEQAMFRRMPLIVGHSSELAGAGDFVVRNLGGREWLLVRGKDGVARAFLNYCQHRGTRLEQESRGCKQRFSCPYHAWTYATDGKLVGVPRSDLFPGLDKSTKHLRAGDLQERYGFLWLTQEPDNARPIKNQSLTFFWRTLLIANSLACIFPPSYRVVTHLNWPIWIWHKPISANM